jgi:hypothetical protein
MKIRILRTAIDYLATGRIFYDRQSDGAGRYFVSCLFAEIDALALVLQAEHHRIINEYHRIITRRFPYASHYEKSGQIVVVHRMPDCRWNPKWIRERLSE